MRIFLLSLFLLIAAITHGQQDSSVHAPKKSASLPTRFFELGVNANAYKGDLNHSYQQFTSAVTLGLRLNFKKRLNSHFALTIGSITGSNPYFQTNYYSGADSGVTPNNFFKTTFVQVNYDLQFNIIKTKSLIVYVSQGIGIFKFTPKDINNNSLAGQLNTRAPNENYNTTTFSFPTSAGFYYLFKNNLGAGFQAGWLNTQTNYLDNIGQLGNRPKNDNILFYRFLVCIPVSYK